MEMYYLFPFGKIKKGAKIIIYGAGAVGQWFLSQLKETSFAEVVAVADRACKQYPDLGIKLILPEEITRTEFDKIIIAIEKPELAIEIKSFLVNDCHIKDEEIIWGCEQGACQVVVIRPLPPEINIAGLAQFAFQREGISLAAFLPGGLGDDIVSKKFLEDLRKLADGSMSIDLYCTRRNRGYVEAIFQEPWYQIYDEPNLYEWNKADYDVALQAEYILRVDHVSVDSLENEAPRLAKMMVSLRDSVDGYGLDCEPMCENSVHFARAHYCGWNAYAAMGHGLLDNTDDSVSIPMKTTGAERFRGLKLPKCYITLNYGWGTQDVRKGLPAKVWVFSYYEQLVKLIKSEFPELSLVQLGTPRSEIIEGIDFFLNSETLETVKYILQQSCLHIDCEGGLVHLATQLGTKCAVLFGPTPESYFGYKSNINICANVCRPCYYVYNDFTLCARRLKEPVCMFAITPKMVMESIGDYLRRKLKH